MKIHTFLDKCCTILKGSHSNMGLNPVAEINMGLQTTRALVHFNVDHLKELVDDIGHNNAHQRNGIFAQSAGHGIGHIAQLAHGLLHLVVGFRGKAAGFVDHPGHRGNGKPGVFRDRLDGYRLF